MEWSEDIIAKLRTLWSEGLSTAEIGRRLNISKNAVVGKAHRLNLPPRPSPIRRGEGTSTRPAPPRRALGPTLPPLSAAVGGPANLPSYGGQAPVLRPIVAPQKHSFRATPCCWPIGEPGKPSFHFCDGAAISGKPYCEEHAALAYVRIRDRHTDAA